MNSNSQSNNKSLLSINLIKFANSVLDEINYARVCPGKYYKKLYEWSQYLKDDPEDDHFLLEIPNKPVMRIRDINNYSAALKFVKEKVPTNPLSMIDCLVSITRDYLAILQMNDDGQVKNVKKYIQSKEEFLRRLSKFGAPQGVIGESITLGDVDVELLVLRLVLDEDFAPEEIKPNQMLIFNNKLRFIGISSGILPSSQNLMTILDYCENIFFKNERLFSLPKQKGYSPSTSVVSDTKYMETYGSDGRCILTITDNGTDDRESTKGNGTQDFFSSQKNSTNTLMFSKSYSNSEKGFYFNKSSSLNHKPVMNKMSNNHQETLLNGNGYQTSIPFTPKAVSSKSIRSEKILPTQSKKGLISLTLDLSRNYRNNKSPRGNQSFSHNNKETSFKQQEYLDPAKSDPLLQNENIENINISKKYFNDKNNSQKVYITRTIRYKDGTINETTYKLDN